MFLINRIPSEVELKAWPEAGEDDIESMGWIFHQLMGETSKGDRLAGRPAMAATSPSSRVF